MRAFELDGSGSVTGLLLRERADPVPGRGQVLVRVRAASLNYRDLMIIDGSYDAHGSSDKAGSVPLSDGCGEVVGLGPDVSRLKVGDRVVGAFFPKWQAGRITASAIRDQPGSSRDGMLAELVVFDEEGVVPLPAHMTFAEGATLPCAALTAWTALNGPRPLLAGEYVLTQGTGGVSLFALQIAKLFGAQTIVTTSTEAKAARLQELGADHVIGLWNTNDWSKDVRNMTGRQGADHIIEIGGAGTLERSLRAAAIGGVVNLIGVLAKSDGLDPSMLMRGISDIRRISVGHNQDLRDMIIALARHEVRPVVDRIFPFEEARDAFDHFAGRHHFGKVVIGADA